MKAIAISLFTSFFVAACVAAPTEETTNQNARNGAQKGSLVLNPSGSNSNSTSTASIKQTKEQEYQRLLHELEQKDANRDAQQAIERGDIHVLGYQAGRGQFKIPSVDQSQNRCAIKQIDGMGDVIYGESHLKYRIAVKAYASQFNQIMVRHCR